MTPSPRPRRRPRWWGGVAIVLLLVGTLVVASVWQPGDRRAAQAVQRPGFLISYAGAADRLASMDELAAAEQLRDWARFALVAELELDTAQLTATSYDRLPVRDAGFADLARQPVGPGRFLAADGVLHLLVPSGDPHLDRTIGLLLDQYRTDAGGDLPRVRLHRYTVHPEIQSIHVGADAPVATGDFRRVHGYVRMRIDTGEGLTSFLAKTRALSTVEVTGGEVWAGGWQWSEGDGQRLTREDVAVLQRGYAPSGSARPVPGFSLEPVPVQTVGDLAAVFPGLSTDLLDSILSGIWDGPRFRSAGQLLARVDDALFGRLTEAETAALGLPADRVHLWALQRLLLRGSASSEALYYGGLGGTEVGMTLFYTDYVAKDWVTGVGSGVPADAVAGFMPDTEADTPLGHCEVTTGPAGESGRLWFGQNQRAFSFQDDRISIGAQPTRLFTRSDGEDDTEVESSYSFGRGLRWWNRHYQAVADYEPQYQRLDQIMRWSAALEWLGERAAELPPYSDVKISDDLRFEDWYRRHDTLRERAPIHFVTPSAGQESVLAVPSATFEDCGLLAIRGGVSLADLGARKSRADRSFQADLPRQVRRAGPVDERSVFDPATGTGSITQVSIGQNGGESSFLRHEISRQGDGPAQVEVTASPRRVIPLGPLKVLWNPGADRTLTVALRGGDGQVSQQVRYLGHDLGGLTAVKQGELITLTWRRGLVDRVRAAAASVQDRLASGRGDAPADGVLYSARAGGGGVLHRVGGEGAPWLSITRDAPAGDGLTFRLGVAGQNGPRHAFATLVADPALPSGAWLEAAPATADTAATVTVVESLPGGARQVPVTTRDGQTATLFLDGESAWAAADDPVLGRDGTVAGAALLRDSPRVAAALRAATDAGDGLRRGVDLRGDGVALVGADGVRLAGAGDPWVGKFARVAVDPAEPPLFSVVDDHLLHQRQIPLQAVPGTRQEGRTLGDVLDEGATVLLHDHLRATLPAGLLFVDALPRDVAVTIVEARVPRGNLRTDTAAQPDIWVGGGGSGSAKWWRVAGGVPTIGTPGNGTGDGIVGGTGDGTGGGGGDGIGDGTVGGPEPQTSPTATSTPSPSPTLPVPILLVCSQDDDEDCAA